MRVADREAGTASLVRALRDYGDEELAAKLHRCQEARLNHRRAVREGRVVPWPHRCRSPACAACRKTLQGDWQDRARRRWREVASTDPDHTSMITGLLCKVGSLTEVYTEIAHERQRLRNKRRGPLSGCALDCVVEVDGMHSADMASCLPGRMEALAQLPEVGRQAGFLWIPSLHGVLFHPDMDRAEVEAMLSTMWPGSRRVVVTPVWAANANANRDVADDASGIIGYGLKHSQTTQVGHMKISWPIEMQAVFWSELCAKKRGVEPLRIRFKPTRQVVQSSAPADRSVTLPSDGGTNERLSCPYTTEFPNTREHRHGDGHPGVAVASLDSVQNRWIGLDRMNHTIKFRG